MNEQHSNIQPEIKSTRTKKTILFFLLGMIIGAGITLFVAHEMFAPPMVVDEEVATVDEIDDSNSEIDALDDAIKDGDIDAKEVLGDGNLDENNPEVEKIDETETIDEVVKVEEVEKKDDILDKKEVEVEDEPSDMILELKKGQSLSTMLSKAGIETKQIYQITKELGKETKLKNLKVGQKFKVNLDNKGLASLSMEERDGSVITVKRADDDSYSASKSKLKLEKTTSSYEGVVKGNFSASARKAGMNSKEIQLFITLYKDSISFSKDIRNGDRFTAYFESMASPSGKIVKDTKLLFASFNTKGSDNNRYYYVTNDGKGDYYDDKGNSISRFLNVRPVVARRISSGFGRRFHPVLHRYIFHYGVDYSARTGTPVRAAGDGVITYAGRKGTYGNYVQIKHNRTYSTAYAHLNGYKQGIKRGTKVKKGQVIAFVGNTGISTGPHLHFEVHKGSVKVDPLKQYAIQEKNLRGKELKNFRAFCARVNPRYAAKGVEKASLDNKHEGLN